MAGRKPNPTDAKTYHQMGNDYYEKGDYDRAIENYNMAILLNPVFSEAYFNRALSYYQLKNFDKSVSDYTKAIELDPHNPIIYNNRGDAYYRKQDFQSAVKDYDKAINLNKNYLKAFYNRGLSYASIEEYEKAIDDFSKVTELKPDFAEAYHLRGLAREYAGDLTGAVTDYEKALELNPELTEAKTHLEGAKSKKEQEGKGEGGEGKATDIQMLQKPNMSFKDVAGMKKMKEEIKEAVIYPMMNPDLARKYGKLGGGGIMMYGPPGCGKCISGDTPVILADGSLVKISELYSQANGKETKINKSETIIENPGWEVLSLNTNNLKIEHKKIDYVYRQRYEGIIYEITTDSGRKIEVTPEHPFISINNGVKKIKAADLSQGSYIAVPRELKTKTVHRSPSQLENFREVETNEGPMLQFISLRHPNTRMIKPAFDMDEEMAGYFGCLLSEGASIPGTMYFSNSDQSLVNEVADATTDLFGITPRIKPDTSDGVYRVEIGSVTLMEFLDKVYDFKLRGSRNTRVPDSIMRANDSVVSKFVSVVFECEACVRKDVPEIEFSTASQDFADGLTYLLLRFGITSRIRPKMIKKYDHTYWRLYISGHENLKKFEELIGFASKRKKNALGKWTGRNIGGSTNKDIIPNIQKLLKKARASVEQNKTEFYHSKNGYRYELSKVMSREYLSRILDTKSTSEEIKRLRRLAESEVLWDKVINITTRKIDSYVYDLTVKDNHTFVAGFGGVVVHNTFIVKAAAGECNAGFVNAKLSDLLDMYVGNTEKNIHKVFELARKNSPCILFFDEVDAIGGRRDQQEGQQYMRMAVNQMLYEMDGVEAHNDNVLIIAATNAPWDVDPALRRSGRFSKAIYVPEPDPTSRAEILKLHASKRPLASFIPYRLLAIATTSYASSDLKAIVDEAASFPWREAFFAIQKKAEELMKRGMDKEKASELAKKQVKQRPITTGDFIKAVIKKKSSLPPWYGQAKKQIGKQEEITIIDGKEHKKVSDSKLGPAEKESFKDLLDAINKKNKWYSKLIDGTVKFLAILILRILTLIRERRFV